MWLIVASSKQRLLNKPGSLVLAIVVINYIPSYGCKSNDILNLFVYLDKDASTIVWKRSKDRDIYLVSLDKMNQHNGLCGLGIYIDLFQMEPLFDILVWNLLTLKINYELEC